MTVIRLVDFAFWFVSFQLQVRETLLDKGSRRPRASSPLQQEPDAATTTNAFKAVWSEATRT
jgi:hypothetical protein